MRNRQPVLYKDNYTGGSSRVYQHDGAYHNPFEENLRRSEPENNFLGANGEASLKANEVRVL